MSPRFNVESYPEILLRLVEGKPRKKPQPAYTNNIGSPTGNVIEVICQNRCLRLYPTGVDMILDIHVHVPHVMANRLKRENYRDFLGNTLHVLLEKVPLAVHTRIWFQHDGAPAHFSLAVRQQQTATFGDRCIGYQGPVPWPARSPDLNPLDFFLWEHLKTLVYATPVDQVNDFLPRIVDACNTIRITTGIFNMLQSMFRRCQYCLQERRPQSRFFCKTLYKSAFLGSHLRFYYRTSEAALAATYLEFCVVSRLPTPDLAPQGCRRTSISHGSPRSTAHKEKGERIGSGDFVGQVHGPFRRIQRRGNYYQAVITTRVRYEETHLVEKDHRLGG
ncbi:hypothetical protein ANN_08634 [Periplaneta americana]|uniref:Uncharacterized protein n=1 Tax=Periplaneta americana TaxID=6978 RepID=A0ABQ8T3F2_PERAM|nr:hypothetical protein ANN_08634 [Periplaneta americana]